MPRFFFDVQGDLTRRDRAGLECADAGEAWSEARRFVEELQSGTDTPFKRTRWSLIVTDERAQVVFRLDFEPDA